MATERGRRPVVVDTDVYIARLIPDSTLARRYEPLLVGRAEFVSFQTVAEVRYGALLRGWGAARLGRMEVALSGSRSCIPAATSLAPTPNSESPASARATL